MNDAVTKLTFRSLTFRAGGLNGCNETTMAESLRSRNLSRRASFTIKRSQSPAQSRVRERLTSLFERLVVHKDNIRLPDQLVRPRTHQHVALLQLDLAHTKPPHAATYAELFQLVARQLRRRRVELDAVAPAASRQASLQDDVANT